METKKDAVIDAASLMMLRATEAEVMTEIKTKKIKREEKAVEREISKIEEEVDEAAAMMVIEKTETGIAAEARVESAMTGTRKGDKADEVRVVGARVAGGNPEITIEGKVRVKEAKAEMEIATETRIVVTMKHGKNGKNESGRKEKKNSDAKKKNKRERLTEWKERPRMRN